MHSEGQFYTWIAEATKLRGAQRSIYCPETTLSRRGLKTRCDRRAREMAGMGIRRGDVVVLALGNVAEFPVLLGALSKLGAVAMPVDPAHGDPALFEAVSLLHVRAVIRRPRGADSQCVEYPSPYQVSSRRRLAASLVAIDILDAPSLAPGWHELPQACELVFDIASGDGSRCLVARDANTLKTQAEAAKALLGIDERHRLACGESLSVPRFFDSVLLPWFASEASLAMAEDPALKDVLALCADHEHLVAVDSLRHFLDLARTLKGVGRQRELRAVIPQSTIDLRPDKLFRAVFGSVPSLLLHLEEFGVLGLRPPGKSKSYELASNIQVSKGEHHRDSDSHELYVSSQNPPFIMPAPEPGSVGSPATDKDQDLSWYHTGFSGKFGPRRLIDVIGRMDRIVNLEGRRCSLSSVEQAFLQHRRITWAQATLRHDADGDSRLSVGYRATGQTELEDLEEYAIGNLPSHMVPRQFERILGED